MEEKELEDQVWAKLPKQLQHLSLENPELFWNVFAALMQNNTNPSMLSDNETFSSNTTSFVDINSQYCKFGFLDAYKLWHCRLALCIGIAGAMANLLTVTTLTRRSMATPTNLLLLGLAVADMLVVVEYIPYSASTLHGGEELPQAKGHALYILVHAHLSHVCHTIAIWLTVSLAVWRWYAVCRPHAAHSFCSMINARKVLLTVYIACPILATPTFLMYNVQELSNPEDPLNNSSKLYKVDFSPLALAHDELLRKINFLVYSVLVKLVPCVLLTLLMPAIIRGMWMAKMRRQKLISRKPSASITTTSLTVNTSVAIEDATTAANTNNNASSTPQSQSRVRRTFNRCSRASTKKSVSNAPSFANGSTDTPTAKSPHRKNEGATERTTTMLLVVMLLFLLTEVPQGLLAGLSLYYGRDFYSDCYLQLGDPMDLLALINSSINFLLYCGMSREFRVTFVGMCATCWQATVTSNKPQVKESDAGGTILTHK